MLMFWKKLFNGQVSGIRIHLSFKNVTKNVRGTQKKLIIKLNTAKLSRNMLMFKRDDLKPHDMTRMTAVLPSTENKIEIANNTINGVAISKCLESISSLISSM